MLYFKWDYIKFQYQYCYASQFCGCAVACITFDWLPWRHTLQFLSILFMCLYLHIYLYGCFTVTFWWNYFFWEYFVTSVLDSTITSRLERVCRMVRVREIAGKRFGKVMSQYYLCFICYWVTRRTCYSLFIECLVVNIDCKCYGMS